MVRVLLTVLGAWLALAVIFAIAFAAIGRSALREDQALGHVSSDQDEARRVAGDVAAPGPDAPETRLPPGPEKRNPPGMTG